MISLAGGREEERRCIGRSTGRPSIIQPPTITVTICLVRGETINNNLVRRMMNNQQLTSTAPRESSGCGYITINEKISSCVSKSGGNTMAARTTAMVARAWAAGQQQ